MKLLIVSALLVAAVSSGPVSHTLEVGSNGVVGTTSGSVLSPLVSLIINIGQGLGNLVSVVGLPETQKPVDPVLVVEHPALPSPIQTVPEVPGVVHPELPEGVHVVEPVLPEAPVQVIDPIAPETPIVVAPELPEGVHVVEPVLPEAPVQVIDPIAPELPEGVHVVEPILPVQVIETPVVIDGQPDSGVNVVDGVMPVPAPVVAPESQDSNQGVTNNFLINVLLNFFTGKDGTPSFSSGLPDISSLPAGLQQLLAPAPAPRIA